MITKADIKRSINYIRVGVDYFKVIEKKDRYGIKRTELKKWNKQEIVQDHDKKILYEMPKYDDFIVEPDNKDYESHVDGFYNLYAPFPHKAKPGQWVWTKRLLEHIFGEQYNIGLKYLQTLYLHPKQPLPVLVLISKTRQTGKSTFIDWLMTIFGANMVIISPADLNREFNGSYSRANIIAIEETLIKKDSIVEKVKSLSTQKTINANLKNVNDFMIPFFGKIVMASNNERKFMKIDDDEIRFFVRRLGLPKHQNHDILNNMIKEIPGFLNHLERMPDVDFSKSRMVFTPEELGNESLTQVKEESRSWLYKELFYTFEELFNNSVIGDEIKFTPKEIKNEFFQFNSHVSTPYIKEVLQDEFKLTKAKKNESYKPFAKDSFKTGQPYTLLKSTIINPDDDMNPELLKIDEIEPF